MTKLPQNQKEETFHKVRSELVDAFARIESALVIRLAGRGQPVKADSLANKLKRAIEAGTVGSATEEQLATLANLVPFRHDIVHGTMVVIDIDDTRLACFRNAKDAAIAIQPAILVSYPHLRATLASLHDIANSIAAG